MPFVAAGHRWVSCSASSTCQKRAALLGVCGVADCLPARRLVLRRAVQCVHGCSLGKWRGMPSALAHGGAGWSSSACARWWRRVLLPLPLPRWVQFAPWAVARAKPRSRLRAACFQVQKHRGPIPIYICLPLPRRGLSCTLVASRFLRPAAPDEGDSDIRHTYAIVHGSGRLQAAPSFRFVVVENLRRRARPCMAAWACSELRQ